MSNKLTEADTYVESLNEIYTFLNNFCKCVTLFECISSPRFFSSFVYQPFKTVLPPIPIFDKFNQTYSQGQV